VEQIQGQDGCLHFTLSSHDKLNVDLEINNKMRKEALVLIEDMCVLMCGSLLSRLGMIVLNRSSNDAFNRELQWEEDYDRDEQAERVQTNVPLLNTEQNNVYDSLMKVVDDVRETFTLSMHPVGQAKRSYFVDSSNNSAEITNFVACCILGHCCNIVGMRSNCTFRLEASDESSHDKPT